jgi:hypothetical protein
MNPPRPTRAPLARAEATLADIGDIIRNVIETECPGYAFALVFTSIGPANSGFFTHASNVHREDLIKLLDEWREKLHRATGCATGRSRSRELSR